MLGHQLLSLSRMTIPSGPTTQIRLETLGSPVMTNVPTADLKDGALAKLEETIISQWGIFTWAIERGYPDFWSPIAEEYANWQLASLTQIRQDFIDFLGKAGVSKGATKTRRTLLRPSPPLKTSDQIINADKPPKYSPTSPVPLPHRRVSLVIGTSSLPDKAPLEPSPLLHTFPKKSPYIA